MAKTKVTINVFNAVKILFENGAKSGEVGKYMKLSPDVVSMIRKSETYEEYRNLMYTKSSSYRKRMAAIKAKEQKAKEVAEEVGAIPASELIKEEPKEERKQMIMLQASHQLLEEFRKQNELLTLISNKLAFIVDELTN